MPELFDPETTSDEEQCRSCKYAERFSLPGRLTRMGFYAEPRLTPAFTDEVYA
jgi:hypothetical protein